MINSISDIIIIVGIFLGIWGVIEFFIVIFLENKYNLINRFNRWRAKKSNLQAKIRMSFRFEINSDFNKLKKVFKEKFIDVEVKKDNDIVLDFNSDIHSIKITHDRSDKTIFIEFYRIGWGIKELKDLIQDEIIAKLNNLIMKDKVLEKFLFCELDLALPYKWSYVNIEKPKGFELKKYIIDFYKKDRKTHLRIITENKLNLKFSSLDIITKVIKQIL